MDSSGGCEDFGMPALKPEEEEQAGYKDEADGAVQGARRRMSLQLSLHRAPALPIAAP
jgi:hypothetical protein